MRNTVIPVILLWIHLSVIAIFIPPGDVQIEEALFSLIQFYIFRFFCPDTGNVSGLFLYTKRRKKK